MHRLFESTSISETTHFIFIPREGLPLPPQLNLNLEKGD